MLQPKDTDWPNGYKNEQHICSDYKKPTSDVKTYRLKERGWKIYSMQMGNERKLE